ncbi:MAG: hypothetical protein WAT93_03440 [Pontixanthobacter sp.]
MSLKKKSRAKCAAGSGASTPRNHNPVARAMMALPIFGQQTKPNAKAKESKKRGRTRIERDSE